MCLTDRKPICIDGQPCYSLVNHNNCKTKSDASLIIISDFKYRTKFLNILMINLSYCWGFVDCQASSLPKNTKYCIITPSRPSDKKIKQNEFHVSCNHTVSLWVSIKKSNRETVSTSTRCISISSINSRTCSSSAPQACISTGTGKTKGKIG